MKRFVLLSATALWCCGCAAQLGPSVAFAGGERTMGVVAAGTLHAFRTNNSVLGVRANAAIDHSLALRSAVLHGGYDFLLAKGLVTLEPGFDLGVGQPAAELFEGVGAYWGFSGTARLRLWPCSSEPAYNLAAPSLELVLWPQGGMWMPPEGASEQSFRPEFSASLGLRFAVGSDVATSGQGHVWDGGPDCEHDPGSSESCSEPAR